MLFLFQIKFTVNTPFSFEKSWRPLSKIKRTFCCWAWIGKRMLAIGLFTNTNGLLLDNNKPKSVKLGISIGTLDRVQQIKHEVNLW